MYNMYFTSTFKVCLMFGALTYGQMHTCVGCILPFVTVKRKKKTFSQPTDPCPDK